MWGFSCPKNYVSRELGILLHSQKHHQEWISEVVMPKCNGGELFEFLANETEAWKFSEGVEYINCLPAASTFSYGFLNGLPFRQVKVTKKSPSKVDITKASNTMLLTLQKNFKGQAPEMVLFFKTPVTKNRGFSICNWWPPTATRTFQPDLHQNFQTSTGSRSRVWGTWIYSTQKKPNGAGMDVDLGCLFFCLGDVFFLQQFLFRPTCFFFPVVWWFAYVYEGVMIAILWYWRFLPWWLDVNVECWTCFWWMIVPMPPRIPTTAGPPKSCQPHISQKGLRLPTCSILPWYLSKCGVAH